MQTRKPKTETNGKVDEHVARYLLAHSSEYRELIKQRVSEARKRQRLSDRSILSAWRTYHGNGVDVDELGREVEGCG